MNIAGPHPNATSGRCLCVLVIGDDPETVATINAHLAAPAGAPVRILTVDSPEHDTDRLRREPIDVALLLHTSTATTLARLDTVRQHYHDLPVVAVARDCRSEDAVTLIRNGFYDVVDIRQPLVTALGRSAYNAAEAQRLRCQAADFETLVAADPDALIAAGGDGTVRFVNEAAGNLFARPGSALLGEHLTFSVEDGTTAQIDIVAAGRELTAEMRSVPIVWSGHRSTLAVICDITDRRQMLEQLYRAQKSEALSRLAGSVAHDFNNLLGVILSNVEVLTESELDDAAAAVLRQIENAGHRAAAITQQLLRFSQRSPAQPQDHDLNTAVRDIVRLAKPAVGVDVQIRTDLDDQLGAIYLDPAQCDQILMNLILNARDAMPDGGTITISTRQLRPAADGPDPAGAFAALTVHDDGEGMTADVLDRCFEPFFTTKTGGRGTGLGLAAVSGIVSQAAGTVTADSAPGAGSTFTVTLPLAGPLPPATPVPDRRNMTTLRVLVAEDEQSLRAVIVRMLEKAGFEVLQAADGSEALAIADREPFDVLLTDILMPGLNGYEAASEVLKRWPQRAVVFMTGYPDADADASGCPQDTPTITKLFDRTTLLSTITQVVKQRTSAPTA